MIELTDKNFETEVLKSDLSVLVEFGADWCGPCQMAEPVIEELAHEYKGKVKVSKLNVEENPMIPQKYSIMSIPTVVVFKNGKEIKRLVGFEGKEGYRKLIDGVLSS